jgi:hypothetical protein
MPHKLQSLVVLVTLLLAIVSCATTGTEATEVVQQQPSTAPEPTATAIPHTKTAAPTATPIPPTDTPQPTHTPAPTHTPTPTETPLPTETPPPTTTPTPFTPLELVTFQGSGETVTENFDAPMCRKTVFFWSVEPNQYGAASLMVYLAKQGVAEPRLMINELGLDASTPLTGETLQPLSGGTYYLSIENLSGPWEVRGVCLDGQPATGSSIDIQGAGLTVTDNFALPKCSKSVFIWSVQPNQYGTASLMVSLANVEADEWPTIVNALKSDLSDGVLTGETLQPLKGGVYYMAIKNVSGPWTLLWDCRD